MSSFDPDKFLSEPIYALDFGFMVGDVEDFLEFSESNVEWQFRREMISVQRQAASDALEPGYKEHLETNAKHRFKVSLPLRVRYAALVALITSVEWAIVLVVGRLRVPLPEKPKNANAIVFFDDEDRQTYLKVLAGYAQRYHVSIWAYCLMGNHIHLLVVPETETALSRGIGSTNLMYTQHLNRKLNQSGRIRQNRFFSCVVERDQSLWAVARYIERNPLKAGLAASAETYRWSSAKAHIIGINDPLPDATPWFSPQQRSAYAVFVGDEDEETDTAIRRATRTGRPFGTEQCIDQLEFRLNQPLRPGKPGRPRTKIGKCP